LVSHLALLAQSKRLFVAAYSSANKEDRSQLELLARSGSTLGKTARLFCSQLEQIDTLSEERQASERLYRMILNSCPAGLIIWNSSSRIADWNPAAERIFGWTRLEAISQASPHFLLHESNWPHVEAVFVELLQMDHAQDSVNENVTKDGRTILCDWRNIPMWDSDGPAQGFVSIVSDITESFREKQLILDTNQRLNTLIEASPLAIYTLDRSGLIQTWNPAAERMFDVTSEEAIGRATPCATNEQSKAIDVRIAKVLKGQAFTDVEIQSLRRDGTWSVLSLSLAPIHGPAGSVTGVLVAGTDITEREKVERELRTAHENAERARHELLESNDQLEQAILHVQEMAVRADFEHQAQSTLLAAIPSILIGIDSEDLITNWNAAAELSYGLSAAEMINTPFENCPLDWNIGQILEAVEQCRSEHRPVRLDNHRFVHANGTEGVLGINMTPLASPNSDRGGILFLAADITHRKKLERELSHAQKMESIGQLAAGIAHEINTPMQYISDNTRFLNDAFEDVRAVLAGYQTLLTATKLNVSPEAVAVAVTEADELYEDADTDYLMTEIPNAIRQTLEGAERVTKIVQAMKEFSHPGVYEKTLVDINRSIQSTITVARNEWKYIAEVDTNLDANLPWIPCFASDFNQVILNIIVNAAHAIAEANRDSPETLGRITVSTSIDENSAEIRIADTGCGIPLAVQSRIFDPFFTTKEVGKGTGQGLAIAHDIIVEKHKGTIDIETAEDKGTTFIIRLPLAAEEAVTPLAA